MDDPENKQDRGMGSHTFDRINNVNMSSCWVRHVTKDSL